jgi:hypothetical protein
VALALDDKIERVTRFLISFGNRQVMAQMRPQGFSPQQLSEGWALAQKAAEPWLEKAPIVSDTNAAREALGHLDDWENRHLPVIEATLRVRYPAIYARVVEGLSQTSGPSLLLTVPRLLANLRTLQAAGDDVSQQAWQLLGQRGITPDVIEQAALLIKQASAADTSPEPISQDEIERQRVEREANVQRMWDWYIEWSAIARARIKDGNVLRRMGFGRGGRPKSQPTEEDLPSDPEEPSR